MIRALIFILKLTLLVAAAVWVVQHPGAVNITWQDYEISTSLAMLVLLVLAVAGVSVVIYAIWRALVGIPQSLSLGHLSRRQRKGYMALTQGLVAVAAGDAIAAQRLAQKAEKYLHEPALTLLLQAQAAQLSGDEAGAARYFSTMLEKPETSFLGLRGLINHALKEGDLRRALDLGYRALKLQPKTGWLVTLLCELEARAGNWNGADELLSRAQKLKALQPDRARSMKVALLLGYAKSLETIDPKEALSLALKAHNTITGFVPAALIAADLCVKNDNASKAAKVIEQTWKLSPHPQLADSYAALYSALPPLDRLKKIERLANCAPSAPESKLAIARAAVKAELWGVARGAVASLLSASGPQSAALCLVMADLDEHENKDLAGAQEWHRKARLAADAPAWVCQSCGSLSDTWAPICLSCQSLASSLWQVPSSKISLLPPE